ncbi:MAG: hypothetical protein R6U30_08860 [Halomonas sp.]
MTAPSTDRHRCHAASAGVMAREVDWVACGRADWYGYFMTGVPVAMS